MDVLDHDPMSLLGTVVKSLDCNVFLTLTHRNIDERAVSNVGTDLFSNSLNVGSRINTREEYEEHGCSSCHLSIGRGHIEG